MPELKNGELSKADLGIFNVEMCPECNGTEIDVEPGYGDNGDVVGSLFTCLNCDWYEVFEEDNPEDAENAGQAVETEAIPLDILRDWLKAYRQGLVEELRQTSNFDKADQRDYQSKISFIDDLLEFFADKNEKTGDTG